MSLIFLNCNRTYLIESSCHFRVPDIGAETEIRDPEFIGLEDVISLHPSEIQLISTSNDPVYGLVNSRKTVWNCEFQSNMELLDHCFGLSNPQSDVMFSMCPNQTPP